MYFLGPLGRKGTFHNTIYRCTFWALWNKKDHCTYIHIITYQLWSRCLWPMGGVCWTRLSTMHWLENRSEDVSWKKIKEKLSLELYGPKSHSLQHDQFLVRIQKRTQKRNLKAKGLKSNIGEGIWSKAWTAHVWCNIFCAECLSQGTKTVNQDKQWWAWNKYVSASSGNGKWYAETRH